MTQSSYVMTQKSTTESLNVWLYTPADECPGKKRKSARGWLCNTTVCNMWLKDKINYFMEIESFGIWHLRSNDEVPSRCQDLVGILEQVGRGGTSRGRMASLGGWWVRWGGVRGASNRRRRGEGGGEGDSCVRGMPAGLVGPEGGGGGTAALGIGRRGHHSR